MSVWPGNLSPAGNLLCEPLASPPIGRANPGLWLPVFDRRDCLPVFWADEADVRDLERRRPSLHGAARTSTLRRADEF